MINRDWSFFKLCYLTLVFICSTNSTYFLTLKIKLSQLPVHICMHCMHPYDGNFFLLFSGGAITFISCFSYFISLWILVWMKTILFTNLCAVIMTKLVPSFDLKKKKHNYENNDGNYTFYSGSLCHYQIKIETCTITTCWVQWTCCWKCNMPFRSMNFKEAIYLSRSNTSSLWSL